MINELDCFYSHHELNVTNKESFYLKNALHNLFLYLEDNTEKRDNKKFNTFHQEVLLASKRNQISPLKINEFILSFSINNIHSLKEKHLADFIKNSGHDFNVFRQQEKEFLLLSAINKKKYEIAYSLFVSLKQNPRSISLSDSFLFNEDRHPLINKAYNNYDNHFYGTIILPTAHKLSHEIVAMYFYLNPNTHLFTNSNYIYADKFKTLLNKKLSLTPREKESILSIAIHNDFYDIKNPDNIFKDWDLKTENNQAYIAVIKKSEFRIQNDILYPANQMAQLLLDNKEMLETHFKEIKLNIAELWAKDKITKLLSSQRGSYQSVHSSAEYFYEDLNLVLSIKDKICSEFKEQSCNLLSLKSLIEENTTYLGEGLKKPEAQKTFLNYSLKITEIIRLHILDEKEPLVKTHIKKRL